MTITSVFALALTLQAQDFRPVEQELLSRTVPKVDKDADAEAVFWEVTMAEAGRVQLDHYVRIKIYSEYGREKHARVDLVIPPKTSIGHVSGRTVLPNGIVIPLDRGAIFEREVVRAGRLRVRAVSFAMPGVEPGAVLEYKWRERRSGSTLHYERLELQRDLPLWSVTYRVKPVESQYTTLAYEVFQAGTINFVRDSEKGFYRLHLENVPAFEEEPHSVPEAAVRAWVLLKYKSVYSSSNHFIELQRRFLASTKPGKEITRTATELTTGLTGAKEKLDKLARFCRTAIRNLDYDRMASPADRKRAGKLDNADEVLDARLGTGTQVNWVFAALARAASFEVFLATLTERDRFFGPSANDPYLGTATNVAVRHEGGYLFHDPATPFLEDGMLRWQEEGMPATISNGGFMLSHFTTPVSPPHRSVFERFANLTIAADGSLEGEVRTSFSGHPGVSRKLGWHGMTSAEIQESVEQDVTARLPSAQVSGIVVKNAADPLQPLTIEYKVRVADYAHRVGTRLFVPLAFFQHGLRPRFEASFRISPMYFPYPWSEEDKVTFKLPPGFAAAPASLQPPAGLSIPETGSYICTVGHDPAAAAVRFERSFGFGRNGVVAYPATAYPNVKRVFDLMHDRDSKLFEVHPVAKEGGKP